MGYADEMIIKFWIDWYKADSITRKKMIEQLVDFSQPVFSQDIDEDLKKHAILTLLNAYLEDLAMALEYYFKRGDVK